MTLFESFLAVSGWFSLMLLFVLCYSYCSHFGVLETEQNATTHALLATDSTLTTSSTIKRLYFYCMNNKKNVKTLTEPGYYFSRLDYCWNTRADCVLNSTMVTEFEGRYYYCHDLHYVYANTPKITQEPCPRLRIRVVYTLIHTLIE